ncbi:MAG: hypothetical protein IJ500_01900 [Alphaproteobacteria bacterium]|nr:hypothetical protein [Alphaproteobacteria bacterium]
MKIYKLAIFSLVAGFATAAIANEISASSVANRKTCDEIAAEIANLSAIVDPDEETIAELTQLKQQQRSSCQRRAGARGTAAKNARRMPITTSESKPESTETTEPVDKTCDTPDENGCCPGEKYTDMGELGFNCCPETGGDCFPPIKNATPEPEPETEPELTDEQKNANLESGLCADGTKPNKFGCCADEIFKDMGNAVFACCPKSGGDCFPPIK